MKRKKPSQQNSLTRPWTPFQLCESDERDPGAQIYKNSRYQVHIRYIEARLADAPHMIHLSLRRLDRETLIPFRDLMRVKRELLGPDIELVELFPAESRLVDVTNQYHYWGVNDTAYRFPLGFTERLVGDGNSGTARQAHYGDGQPSDWLSAEEVRSLVE